MTACCVPDALEVTSAGRRIVIDFPKPDDAADADMLPTRFKMTPPVVAPLFPAMTLAPDFDAKTLPGDKTMRR